MTKRTKITLGTLIGIACAAALCIPELLVLKNEENTATKTEDYLIVFGAKTSGTEPSNSLEYRLEAAKEYLAENQNATVIVSGFKRSDETISEAESMKNWLVEHGVSEERIIMETAARSTQENAQNSVAIIAQLEGDTAHTTVAICSSAYHLYRASAYMNAAGVSPTTVAASNGSPTTSLAFHLREIVTIWKMWLGY